MAATNRQHDLHFLVPSSIDLRRDTSSPPALYLYWWRSRTPCGRAERGHRGEHQARRVVTRARRNSSAAICGGGSLCSDRAIATLNIFGICVAAFAPLQLTGN